ncbi:MAG TPA: hypothetical protein VH639_29555 [Bryobacteraceae bacterium]|jgi:hypothetical protein
MPFFYQSSEEIIVGDRVSLHGLPARVEIVADPEGDPENWYVTEYGGGIMIAEPEQFGHLFIPAPVCDYEDLDFLARDLVKSP